MFTKYAKYNIRRKNWCFSYLNLGGGMTVFNVQCIRLFDIGTLLKQKSVIEDMKI